MSSTTPRFIIENSGPDLDALKTALQGAIGICASSSISVITFLVSQKQSFPSTVVGSFLGTDNSKALCDGSSIQLAKGLSANLLSEKTFQLHQSYGMLIGVYLSQSGINLLDSANAKAIVFLPWTENEGKSWLATWNPTTLGKSTWQVAAHKLDKPVEDSLETLTQLINLSTGLSHPSDNKSAKDMFSRLKASGHRPDAESVRIWALNHNWQPDHAEDLKKLSQAYFSQ